MLLEQLILIVVVQSSAYARALKKRDELLEAYEALDSQMSSALQQLSWTLALPPSCSNRGNSRPLTPGDNLDPRQVSLEVQGISSKESLPEHSVSDAIHVMVLVGASLSTPKARMIMEIDNFDIRPFGWREDGDAVLTQDYSTEARNDTNGANNAEIDELTNEFANTSIDSTESRGDDEDASQLDEGKEPTREEEASFVSTAESAATRDSAADIEPDEEDETDELGDEHSTKEDEEYDILSTPSSSSTKSSPFDAMSRTSNGSVTIHIATSEPSRTARQSTPLLSHENPSSSTFTTPSDKKITSIPHPIADSHPSPSSEPFLRATERLIYRTLAAPPLPSNPNISTTFEDDDDDELPLSQTTVLIRAPRRFNHTAFVPRQMYTKDLNGALQQYLQPLVDVPSRRGTNKKAMWSSKVKTTGLRVYCRQARARQESNQFPSTRTPGSNSIAVSPGAFIADSSPAENEDEMIWWEWRGKLKGVGDEIFS